MIKSIQFPKMFNKTSAITVEDHEATVQNLRLLLLSDKSALFGDPYYGTVIKRLMFNQNDIVLQDIVRDAIYTAILQFMPQLKIERKNITLVSEKQKIHISIKATNILDYELNTYNLVLTQGDIN